MVARAILLDALAAFLLIGIVQADDTPPLAGSAIKTEDIALKCDAVFVGKITDAGVKFDRRPELLHGVKVAISQIFRGSTHDQILLSVEMIIIKPEMTPEVGNSYIFFVEEPMEGQMFDPFIAHKLLPATDNNIAVVKKLISN